MNLPEVEQHGASTSLDRILEFRSPPPETTRLAILLELAKKIDAAFKIDGMRGDLTPENILVSGNLGSVDVVVALKDAGYKFIPEEEVGADGAIPDAAHYLPPERILGTGTDIRSHEFSLAVIAHEFVCGKKPFEAPDLAQLFYRVCTGKPVSTGESDRGLSREVSAVLKRALDRDKEQRFPDCKTFVEALAAALQGCSGWAAIVPIATVAAPVQRADPGAPPSSSFYESSTTRLRNRNGENKPAIPADRSRTRKFGLIAALCLALMGLALFFLRYQPNLPVQVLDTNAGPATPPPETQLTHAKKNPPPAVGVTSPARKPRNTPAPAISAVEFLTDPPSAEIVVDGSSGEACKSPCTLSLPSGRHTLSANLSGFSRAQRIFTLPEDKSLIIPLSRRIGTLLVTSVPSGSALMVDGRNYGVTPATLHLPPGQHRLLLINGERQHSDVVNVEADAIQAKAVNW